MKGTVVSTWIKTCRKLYNDDIVDNAIEKAGMSRDKTFTPLEDVEDSFVYRMTENIAKGANTNVNSLWRSIGNDNINTFTKDYPAFFKHDNLYDFLKSMYDVHVIVVKRIPGAKPPILDLKPISQKSAIFKYSSKRGMFEYFKGLIEGASKYYNEHVEIEEISKTNDSLELRLTFEKDIYSRKTYKMNKILSLGFIKDISAKTAILSTLVFAVLNTALMITVKSSWTGYLSIIIAFLSVYLSSKIVNMPLKDILKEFEKIKNHDYVENIEIKSKDSYEDLFYILQEYKASVRKDFVGFKGMTDEMNTFSSTLNLIANKMNTTSSEISGVVEQEQVQQLHRHRKQRVLFTSLAKILKRFKTYRILKMKIRMSLKTLLRK
jgi:methyl-accepting chemotaxis protein